MKTRNSTPWCNLYSTELKYNVTITPTYYAFYSYVVAFIATFCFFLVQFTYAYYVAVVLVSIMVFLLGFLLNSAYVVQNKWLNFVYKHNTKANKVITLSQARECEFNNQYWIIDARSRISFMGCWLVLNAHSQPQVFERVFIFKSSLDAKDYARLYRVINAH